MGLDTEENQMMVIPKVDKEIYEQRRKMAGTMVDYKEMRMRYSCAIKEVRTKFDVLNSEFNVRYQRNPITSINSRLKSSTSIMEKLNRKGLPFTVENVEENLYDVAGIRVVCSYVDDIYMLAEALAQQDDITVIRRKDYIRNPKPNGYRSYHLIVSVPVFFSDQTREMAVEVQIRTIAMDFWASLEHQLKYKQEVPNQAEIVKSLTACAEQIALIDEQMWQVRRQIESSEDLPTEEEILLEKLRKIDIAVGE
ncbi:MAG: GTP pyrophosphokinase family protein [Lachnospiraceae bacterium]|nr:GTP pyrophosphokinase family protein [Lachnospiraceae bacterium]MDE7177418.1 GTP pyrophosphokinase family protein [Lachnospiraceae bacterium]